MPASSSAVELADYLMAALMRNDSPAVDKALDAIGPTMTVGDVEDDKSEVERQLALIDYHHLSVPLLRVSEEARVPVLLRTLDNGSHEEENEFLRHQLDQLEDGAYGTLEPIEMTGTKEALAEFARNARSFLIGRVEAATELTSSSISDYWSSRDPLQTGYPSGRDPTPSGAKWSDLGSGTELPRYPTSEARHRPQGSASVLAKRRSGSSPRRVPGFRFEITTNSSGLRVHVTGAYCRNFRYFDGPTTPVSNGLLAGSYVFGVDRGRGTRLDADSAVVVLPGTDSIHLDF